MRSWLEWCLLSESMHVVIFLLMVFVLLMINQKLCGL